MGHRRTDQDGSIRLTTQGALARQETSSQRALIRALRHTKHGHPSLPANDLEIHREHPAEGTEVKKEPKSNGVEHV